MPAIIEYMTKLFDAIKRTGKALVLCFALAVAAMSSGAPFAEWINVKLEDGRVVRIFGEGDEYSAYFESEDGHAIIYDQAVRAYVYADKDARTGALVSTDICVGHEYGNESILAAIPLHLRDTSEAESGRRRQRILEQDEATDMTGRWRRLKLGTRSRKSADADVPDEVAVNPAAPSHETTGSIVGLTILIDFPAEDDSDTTLSQQVHPSVTKADIEDLLNAEGVCKYGNASSVRKYFYDVSCGHLNYTNIVVGWFVMPYPRSHYDDPSRSTGECARPMIIEAFRQMREDPMYSTKYEPLLRQLTLGDYSAPKAINVFFAGDTAPVWNRGLWAHKSSFGGDNWKTAWYTVDGTQRNIYRYQISPITSSPSIGTFCHENGHMVCAFPDLYRYDSSIGGVGKFCLMDGSVKNTNPQCFSPYLRAAAGWIVPKELSAADGKRTVSCNLDDVWKWTNPKNEKEYYLVENRRKKGMDADLPGEGILIWRCHEERSNTASSRLEAFAGTTAESRLSNELSLEQADGCYAFEQYSKNGTKMNTWHAANRSMLYRGRFDDNSIPCAKWEDGSDSGLRLSGFSAIGDVMYFHVGDPPVVEVSFDANGGLVETASREYVVGQPYGFLPVPTRRGYLFTGWTALSGADVAESDLAPDTTAHLVAKWQVKAAGEYPDIAFGKRNNWSTEVFMSPSSSATAGTDLFAEGEDILLYLGYRNAGSKATDGEFYVRISLLDSESRRLNSWEYRQTTPLLANSGTYSWNASKWGMLQSLPSGQYLLRVELDPDDEIEEYDESDNIREIRFTVGASHLLTYKRGAYGVGNEESFPLSGVAADNLAGGLFSRDGYAQTGWSTDFWGTVKTYELNGSCSVDTSLTLYPYWSDIRPDLAFRKRSNWDAAVFLSDKQGATTGETVFPVGSPVYLYCRFGNEGPGAITNDYTIVHEVVGSSGAVIRSQPYDCTTSLWLDCGEARDWNGAIFTVLQNLPAGRYRYQCRLDSKDAIREVDEGNNFIAIDFMVAGSISDALDNTDIPFVCGASYGATSWEVQSEITHDGVDAARSGPLGNNQTNWVEAVVNGSGTLAFWWYVSSEAGYDKLQFLLDGQLQVETSGTDKEWERKSFYIDTPGDHVLTWRYQKDGSTTNGLDAGFVDEVAWTADTIPAIADGSTSSEVDSAIDGIPFADPDSVKQVIGGSSAEYVKFRAWAHSVAGGEQSVIASTNAAVSYVLGAERVFEHVPAIEIVDMSADDLTQGIATGNLSLAVVVNDGDTAIDVDADKVAGMFEATSRLGDWQGESALPVGATALKPEGDGVSRFTITIGDGNEPCVFLRIRVK